MDSDYASPRRAKCIAREPFDICGIWMISFVGQLHGFSRRRTLGSSAAYGDGFDQRSHATSMKKAQSDCSDWAHIFTHYTDPYLLTLFYIWFSMGQSQWVRAVFIARLNCISYKHYYSLGDNR